MASELYDYSGLTGGNSLDLLGHLIRWGMAGKKLRTTQFTAQALTDGIEVGDLKTVFGSSQDRIMFKARLIAPNPPYQPPDPCDPAYFNDVAYVYKLISMHPWFVSIKDTSVTSPVTRGDLILVELEARGPKSKPKFNMKYGRFIKLLSVEDPSPEEEERCAVLIKMFGKINHEPLEIRKMKIEVDSGHRTKGVRQRTIIFNNIKHDASPSCVPANRNAKNVKDYFGKDLWEKYKDILGARESGNDEKAYNEFGYLGRWQFGIEAMVDGDVMPRSSLDKLGGCKNQRSSCKKKVWEVIDEPSNWSGVASKKEWFANKGGIQDTAMLKYTQIRFAWLKANGVLDLDNPKDVAGMLAASHLIGFKRAKKMKKNNTETSDAYGTFPSDYYTLLGAKLC